MSRSWQGVVASQERGASPALPLAEVEVLALEQVAVAAVVSSAQVLPAAKVGEVASSAQVVATAVVVPLRAAAEGDDDTAAAQVVPGRANEVVPSRAVSSQRGGSETRIATGPGRASVVLLLEKVLPTERSHSGGWGGQRRASIAGRGLRPSWRLLESCRDRRRRLGHSCSRDWFRRLGATEASRAGLGSRSSRTLGRSRVGGVEACGRWSRSSCRAPGG